MTGLTVLKLGGSHAYAPHLPHWIAAIEAAAGEIVVVPGGGVFADAVRNAQAQMGYDDKAAHVMAMLAMAQYAYALSSIAKCFTVADSVEAIDRCLAERRVPVWSPMPMALQDCALAQSWDVTSDSLALWLARQLGCERLVLVKHRLPAQHRQTAKALAADGIVDDAFPSLYCEFPKGAWVAGPDHYADLSAQLSGIPTAMTRVQDDLPRAMRRHG